MEFTKDKFLLIIENIYEGYFEVDLKGTFTFFNESLRKLTGYSREELLGLSYKHIADEQNAKKIFEGFNSVYRTGIPLKDLEYQFKNKTGDKIIGETSIYLKYDSKGDKIGFYGLFRDITKKKEEEELFRKESEQLISLRTRELKESEEKFHQLFNKAPYPIGLFDLKGNLIDCNSATNILLSTSTLEDYVGKNYREFWSYNKKENPLIELFNNVFSEIIQTGKTVNFEFPIYPTVGPVIWNSATTSKIKIGDKEYIQIILMDISAQKEAQQKLKESEEKYRNLVENAQEGVWAVDENDITILVNPKLCEMLGYMRDEIMGKSLYLFLENSMVKLIKSYRERREKGLKDTYELDFIKKDGTILSTSINAAPIFNNNGEFKGSFAFVNDITTKKIAEQKLRVSEERYRNLIESVPFSIALIDLQGRVTYCNPSVEKLLGFSQEELIGILFKDLPLLHPKYIPEMLKRFESVLKGEILPPLDIELYKKDGGLIWMRYQSTLVKFGDEVLIQTVLNDITEQKHADFLIKEEIQKLKELDQIRKDLISRVSHELKTPLVSVCGAAELLLDTYIEQFKDEPKELIEMIEKGGKRLKYLVDNLVDITRIEYKKFRLERELSDFSQIIRDCTNELMYLIKKRKINIKLNLIDNISIEIDKVRIEQVILNLLSNAIKNTPPNGLITINTSQIDNFIQFSISDTGIGLVKDEIDKLFTRFGKIERYGDGLEYIDIQGTGLGLFISKEIIDLHEGTIIAESEGRDKGSTFIVKLPLNKIHSK